MTQAVRSSLERLSLFVLVAVAAAGAGGCGGATDSGTPGHAGGDSEHVGHEHSEPKTDAHHVADGRPDCEDDVLLPEGALDRYGIEIAPVRAVRLVPTITAPGHLAFPQDAVTRVGSAVAGRVVEVRVRSGDTVASGDPLLVVESPQLGEAQSDYLQKRSLAATAGPSVEFARSAYERARQLYESVEGVAYAEVERREAEFRAAERDRTVALAAEAGARNRLLLLGLSEAGIQALEETGRIEPRFTIVSPLAGRVAHLAVTRGELVDSEKDSLLVIGNLDTLWAIAEVAESRLAEVSAGARGWVSVAALGGLRTESVVTSIAPVLEASMRTVEVRTEVSNPDGRMLPGMFVTVEIESNVGADQDTLAVPDAAVLDIGGGPCVFVPVDPSGTSFCLHPVKVGKPVGALIPVLGGLEEGDLLVVSGAFRLKAEHGKDLATHEH